MEGQETLGDLIAEFTEREHITLDRLAEALGVSRQALWFWQTGKRKPGPSSRAKLAAFGILPAPLGLSADQIIAAAKQKLAAELRIDAKHITIIVES
jgi:transcriptional regulator with XRE-family HTH domain